MAHRLIIVFWASVLLNAGAIYAQDHISSLTQSSIYPLQAELFLYASGGSSENLNLWTASNYGQNKKSVFGNFFDIGIETELYHRLKKLRLCPSFGYKYELYSFNNSLINTSGVRSHWLSSDLGLNVSILSLGVRSDIYLSSRVKNNDHFSLEGIYGDCFNRISFCCYIGVNIRLTQLKIEGRMGSYLSPQLSPERLSYHNMTRTYVDGRYYEIKVLYRLFTTDKVHFAPSLFE